MSTFIYYDIVPLMIIPNRQVQQYSFKLYASLYCFHRAVLHSMYCSATLLLHTPHGNKSTMVEVKYWFTVSSYVLKFCIKFLVKGYLILYYIIHYVLVWRVNSQNIENLSQTKFIFATFPINLFVLNKFSNYQGWYYWVPKV